MANKPTGKALASRLEILRIGYPEAVRFIYWSHHMHPATIHYKDEEGHQQDFIGGLSDYTGIATREAFFWLRQEGYLKQTEKPENANWSCTYYRVSEEGRQFYDKHKPALQDFLDQEEAKKQAVDRLIVVKEVDGVHRGWSTRSHKRKYLALLRVIRETDKRLYVEIVANCNGDKNPSQYTCGVQGNRKNYYVSRDQVVLDGVTEDAFARLVAFENERDAHFSGLKSKEEEEIAPIRQRYADRRKQAEAMFEDEEAEVLRGLV